MLRPFAAFAVRFPVAGAGRSRFAVLRVGTATPLWGLDLGARDAAVSLILLLGLRLNVLQLKSVIHLLGLLHEVGKIEIAGFSG